MLVGVTKETFAGERRVALVPGVVGSLTKASLEVVIEAGAGASAGFEDGAFEEKGARVVGSRSEVFAAADVVLQVRAAGANREAGRADLELMRSGQAVVAFLEPLAEPESAKELAGCGVSAFSVSMGIHVWRGKTPRSRAKPKPKKTAARIILSIFSPRASIPPKTQPATKINNIPSV